METFKLDLTGYEIKVITRCYRYCQVYTQIRYLVRESAIITNILKNRLNTVLRPIDRPIGRPITVNLTTNLQTLNSKCSLTDHQFLAITSSYSLSNNGDHDENDNETDGKDANNNHNSSGDIYTHIHNITQPNSYNNGLILLASTNNALTQLPSSSSYAKTNFASGGVVVGVDVAKLSLRIIYTGLIQDVLSTKFKLNITTLPTPTTTANKKDRNSDDTSSSVGNINSNAGTTATVKTEEVAVEQVKESVSKFLQSHPCDKTVRIYVTQVCIVYVCSRSLSVCYL